MEEIEKELNEYVKKYGKLSFEKNLFPKLMNSCNPNFLLWFLENNEKYVLDSKNIIKSILFKLFYFKDESLYSKIFEYGNKYLGKRNFHDEILRIIIFTRNEKILLWLLEHSEDTNIDLSEIEIINIINNLDLKFRDQNQKKKIRKFYEFLFGKYDVRILHECNFNPDEFYEGIKNIKQKDLDYCLKFVEYYLTGESLNYYSNSVFSQEISLDATEMLNKIIDSGEVKYCVRLREIIIMNSNMWYHKSYDIRNSFLTIGRFFDSKFYDSDICYSEISEVKEYEEKTVPYKSNFDKIKQRKKDTDEIIEKINNYMKKDSN